MSSMRSVARRTAIIAIVTSTLAGLAGCASNGPHGAPSETGPGAPQVKTAPTGLQYGSSLGMEILVPEDWKHNDTGCHQTAAPSLNFGNGPALMCYTPTPIHKEWATIREDQSPAVADEFEGTVTGVHEATTTLDGVAATRGTGRLPHQMYAGWIRVPTRNVDLLVRTRSAAATAAILDSAALVDVDNLGYATRQPSGTPARPPRGAPFIDPEPRQVVLCYYGSEGTTLSSSGVASGTKAADIAAALNAAPDGRTPDVPKTNCTYSAFPPRTDAILYAYSSDGTARRIDAAFSSCTERGLFNGNSYKKIDVDLVGRFMILVSASYGIGEIPSGK
jgi:hypothetical protein